MSAPLVTHISVMIDRLAALEIMDHENIAVLRLRDANFSSIEIHPMTHSRVTDLAAIAELGRKITFAAEEDLLAEMRKGRILVEGMARLVGSLS
jgi:hypothetical protein